MKLFRIGPKPVDLPVTEPEQPQSYYDSHAAYERSCRVRAYEPGADHEHVCLASSTHPGLDHTCGHIRTDWRGLPLEDATTCCKTWPDIEIGPASDGAA